MEPSEQKSQTVLFIGRCFMNGYPFTQEEGFVHIACEILSRRGYRIEPARLAPVRTTDLAKFAEAIEQHKPSVTVLQTGGLETIRLLEDVIRGWFGIAKPKRVFDQHLHTSPFRTPWLKFQWRVMVALKRIADTLLLHPIVNFTEFRANLRAAIELIRDRTDGTVLILGLFPSACPISSYYRIRMEPIFIEECARAGVHYLNAPELWRRDGLNSSYYHDPIHINVQGHAWFATHVADALEPCLREAAQPDGGAGAEPQPVSYSAPGSTL